MFIASDIKFEIIVCLNILKMDLVISDIHADILALTSILDLVSSKDFEKNMGNFLELST